MAQTVKRLPTLWETQVRALDREDPLEKEMVTHSSTLAWRILWTEEHSRLLQPMGSQSRTRLSNFTLSHSHSLDNEFSKLHCYDHHKDVVIMLLVVYFTHADLRDKFY